jgi:hypothetical protein
MTTIRAERLHAGDNMHVGDWDLLIKQAFPETQDGAQAITVVTAQLGPLYPLHLRPDQAIEIR